MDFVSMWKAVSIVLTGAFGVLGLLKDFKDKVTHRITPWGYISLAGIILSTSLGVTAQIIESSKNAIAQQLAAKHTTETAEQTLRIVKNSEAALRQLRRTLSPIGDARLMMNFRAPCGEAEFRRFCDRARVAWSHPGPGNLETPSGGIIGWPTGDGRFELMASVRIFANRNDAYKYAGGKWMEGDLSIEVSEDSDKLGFVAGSDPHGSPELNLTIWFRPSSNSGAIQSKLDLSGATVVVNDIRTYPKDQIMKRLPDGTVEYSLPSNFPPSKLIPRELVLSLQDAEKVLIPDDTVERIETSRGPAFLFTAPVMD
jgi:hypothetical protein